MINHLPYSTFWGHLVITEALWMASVCNGYRYSTLWAYPLITEICLEGNAEGISAGQINVTGLDFAESDFAVSDF